MENLNTIKKVNGLTIERDTDYPVGDFNAYVIYDESSDFDYSFANITDATNWAMEYGVNGDIRPYMDEL